MPIAKCGIQFSWDTPMWCKAGDKEKCQDCPLNEKYNKETTIFDEDFHGDYARTVYPSY